VRINYSVIPSSIITLSFGVLVLVGLYLTSLYSYLLFHSLAEVFSIVVACGIFMLVWNARRFIDQGYFLLLGIAYVYVGALDLVHTLAYPGMNVFQGSDTNVAAQLWIAARYVQSVSLLIAPLIVARKLRANLVLVAYGIIVALLLSLILHWQVFPVCFVEGVGLTPFKVISEYVISLILLASVGALYVRRSEFDLRVLGLLMASILVAVASELSFTQYAHAYTTASVIGHLLKIVSFYLIYKAVIETGLVKPYDLLFRSLKQEQKALRESEERYRDLVENIDDVIYTVDANGVVSYVSPAVESWLGYSPSEIVGRHFRAFVLEEDLEAAREGFARVLGGATGQASKYRALTKEGDPKWIRASTRPILQGDRIAGVRGVLSDITERERAEQARRQSEARLELAVAGLNGGVWDMELDPDDPSSTLPDEVFLSPRLKRLIGYGDEELPNSMAAWESRVLPEDLGRLRESSQKYREGKIDRHELEYRIRHKDGSIRWLRTSGRVERKEDGRPVRFAGIDWDITERKRAEEELLRVKDAAIKASHKEQERREEAERRRLIAESLADVIAVLNSRQSLDEVLDFIAMQAGRLLGNQAAGIYRLEYDDTWVIKAAQGLLPPTHAAGRQMPIGHEALRRAMVSRIPEAIPDLAGELLAAGQLATKAAAGARPDLYQALLAVPIIVGDEVYGGIGLYYSEPREFPQEEIDLARAFGDQVALAIENDRLRDQVREAATLAERERLARELHDAVTQTLFSAGLIAEALPRVWERDPERAREGLEELRQLTRAASAEMRALLVELRPAALTEKPLGDLLGHLRDAVTIRTRVPVTLTVEGDSSLPPEMQIALYRISQEALNNVIKHAAATEASIHLRCEPARVTLTIKDNGRGFDVIDALPDQLGVGIMRERAWSIGAQLEISSRAGRGTQVMVDWQETNGAQPRD
jgi:PAS domain S-box-containing protein